MKILIDTNGKAIVSSQKAYAVEGTSPDLSIPIPKYTGTVDVSGLTALGWDSYDIQWLQDHVWWDAEDDDYWKVSSANLAFGPSGATPLTWANRATIKTNPDVRYLPKFDPSPSSNTSWSGLFNGYIYLYAIPTHGWHTEYVTNFQNLFYNCRLLRSVGDLTSWNTAKVTTLYQSFYYCYSLMDIGDIGGWNTAAVTNMSLTFYYCKSLRKIGDISGWNTGNVTTFNSLFYCCYLLDDIGDLSSWNTAKVTSITTMFYNCNSLRKVGKLDTWNTEKLTGSLANVFGYCYSLQYPLDLTSWDVSRATSIANMFVYCYCLTSVGDLSGWNTVNITSFSNTFNGCHCINSLGDLSRWNTSKVTTMESLFSACFLLKPIGYISGWDTSKVTTFYYLFNNCFFLQGVGDLTRWNTSAITTASRCFYQAKLLRKRISTWNVSGVKDFSYMFNGIYDEELDISGWNLGAATSVGTSANASMFAAMHHTKILRLGPHFFDSTIATYYFNQMLNWTRESIVESLYTNQTLRNSSSTAVTVKLSTEAYDRLTADDISNITSKKITLTRG